MTSVVAMESFATQESCFDSGEETMTAAVPPDSGFTRRLKQAGFAVDEVKTRANGKRGARHVIWIATNPR